MSSQLVLTNLALIKAGISQRLTSTTEASQEAETTGQFFRPTFREILRMHPWNFATKYASAAQAGSGDAMELYVGSSDAPYIENEWTFGYRYPVDCLFARRLVTANGRKYEPSPAVWIVGRNSPQDEDAPNDDILLVCTNLEDPVLEFTADVEPVLLEGIMDAVFENAFTTLFASKCALTLGGDVDLSVKLYKQALLEIPTAQVINAREQQQELLSNQDASWIATR